MKRIAEQADAWKQSTTARKPCKPVFSTTNSANDTNAEREEAKPPLLIDSCNSYDSWLLFVFVSAGQPPACSDLRCQERRDTLGSIVEDRLQVAPHHERVRDRPERPQRHGILHVVAHQGAVARGRELMRVVP